MKKICMVLPNNIYLAPYVKRYVSLFCKAQINLIYWDRFDMEEQIENVTVKRFINVIDDKNISQITKLTNYIKFAKFVKRILKIEKYDCVIVFQPAMLILLAWIRSLHNIENLIVDIRDFTYEGLTIFRLLEKNAFRNCKYIVISSPWYKEFLPKNKKYIVMHNTNEIEESFKACRNQIKKNKMPIVIGFIGLVRFIDQNCKIIDKFKNDSRFELRFIGKGSEQLKYYIKNNEIHNVRLLPQFDPAETCLFFSQIDIVLNMYGSSRQKLKYALSNKLYYAAELGKPILVSPDTCMQIVAEQYKIGFACVEEDTLLADKVFNYYMGINWNDFYKNCDSFLSAIEEDNTYLHEIINNILL